MSACAPTVGWSGAELVVQRRAGVAQNIQVTTSLLANTVPVKTMRYSPGKEALNCTLIADEALRLKI